MEQPSSLYKRQVNLKLSVVLVATRILQLSVTGYFLWVVVEVTTVREWLGVRETKLFLLQSNEVGNRCWATCPLGLCVRC